MKKINSSLLTIAIVIASFLTVKGQSKDPDFVGDAYLLKTDSSHMALDKDYGDYTSGVSWSSNSWNALSLEVSGGKAQTRFSVNDQIQFVVRAVDNNSDPMTILTIYKFKAKKKSRTVVLSEDNSGTAMKSRTNSKDMVRFSGKKFGTSSYLLILNNLKPGEYGIVVTNPNSKDQKKTVVSCFGID